MICALCGRTIPAPVSGSFRVRSGEPLVSGPVCNWCHETRIRPLSAKPSEGAPKGAWVVRTSDGLTVSSDAWWVAHELASSTGMAEEDACAMAEKAVAGECGDVPVAGRSWAVMGVSVQWMSPVFLQSPARLVPASVPENPSRCS